MACVDRVVTSSDLDPVFDFASHWIDDKPDILAVTEDDKNAARKEIFCKERGVKLVVLPKGSDLSPVSTTSILTGIKQRKD